MIYLTFSLKALPRIPRCDDNHRHDGSKVQRPGVHGLVEELVKHQVDTGGEVGGRRGRFQPEYESVR